VPVLFGILFMAFIITRLLPGDPVLMMMSIEEFGASENSWSSGAQRSVSDRALPVQYVAWVREVFQGNLGTSFHRRAASPTSSPIASARR
jgi:peptide/nickel transport system permease protein